MRVRFCAPVPVPMRVHGARPAEGARAREEAAAQTSESKAVLIATIATTYATTQTTIIISMRNNCNCACIEFRIGIRKVRIIIYTHM